MDSPPATKSEQSIQTDRSDPNQTDTNLTPQTPSQSTFIHNLDVRTVLNPMAIPSGVSLSNVLLPDRWVLYLYDKNAFKKLASNDECRGKPYSVICTLSTLNDLIYLIQFMNVRVPPGLFSKGSDGGIRGRGGQLSTPHYNRRSATNQINLDMNDYIVMREGVAPIWEDPRNKDGATFSVKLNHKKGFELWKTMVLRMVGETMMDNMHYITGMSMSYIPVSHNAEAEGNADNSETFLKIWDGKTDRNHSQFLASLSSDISSFFKKEETRYTFHGEKPDYDKGNIVSKISGRSDSKRGGFRPARGGGGRGRGRF